MQSARDKGARDERDIVEESSEHFTHHYESNTARGSLTQFRQFGPLLIDLVEGGKYSSWGFSVNEDEL